MNLFSEIFGKKVVLPLTLSLFLNPSWHNADYEMLWYSKGLRDGLAKGREVRGN